MTPAELAAQAEAAIRKTTVSYPEWSKRVARGLYPAVGGPSQFGLAFQALQQIQQPPAPPPTPPTTLTANQFEAKAVAGATIANARVTGWATITNPHVTLRNVSFDGGITVKPTADYFGWVEGSATAFYHWGAEGGLYRNLAFDGKGVTDDCKLWGWDGKLPSADILRCTFTRFHHDADPSSHNQALFIGSSEHVVVDGCRFTDNGNTAHLFVSSFGETPGVPGYVRISGNTFGDTHGAYFSVNVHPDEIPVTAHVYVEPGQPSVKPLCSRPVFVRSAP